MDEPEYTTVTLRVKLQETVGDFKKAVAEEAQNLFFKDKKLEDDSEKLVDIGVGPESVVTNIPSSKPKKMFHGPLSANSFIKLVYGILSVVRMPRIQKDPNASHTLFSLPVRPALESIINELDIVSFVRFSSTCKWLRSFSLHNSALRVYIGGTIDVDFVWNHLRGNNLRIRFNFEDSAHGNRLMSKVQLETIQKLPLEVYVELNIDRIQPLTAETLAIVSEYIRKFRRIVITSLDIGEHSQMQITCWPELIDFIKSHSIKNVKIHRSPNTMSEDQFESMMLMNLEYLEMQGHLSPKMYRRIRMDGFNLTQSALTVLEFKEILALLAEDQIFIRDMWSFEHIHPDFLEPDTFESCFEYYKELQYDYDDDLPETRPIVTEAVIDHGQTQIYLLTRRNKLFIVRFEESQDDLHIHREYEADYYDGPEMFRRFME